MALLTASPDANAAPDTGDAARADVKAGVDAWSAGNYAEAVALWQPLAAKDDPDALFNLAQAYKLGRGVPEDLDQARRLYGRAAALGHVQAADTYGLLLFQEGEREAALPYIKASAKRGDPRAQYVLGIAHFNGDFVPKDWVEAYALLTLARQDGLPQASKALAQMDGYIPLEQRQQGIARAGQLAQESRAERTRQAATIELAGPSQETAPGARTAARGADPLAQAATRARGASAAEAGADYARPAARSTTPAPATNAWPAPSVAFGSGSSASAPIAKAPPATRRPANGATPPAEEPAAPHVTGPWELQLGAFGVEGNAQKLWSKVRTRPEIQGTARRTEPAGRLTVLFASGYPSRSAASSACAKLKAGGYDCLVTRN
ncbi:SPOR domain-containing protein [Novosphingobium mangrovi (ex Hu et al. 2023)]|uniref:SPOR domain-containing protein n=1 Tax=Novosphingobium mangrovi (ex Hu et al. 2023) TaxID=2930094 RepID=A0ABT0AH63_9SPHN|nr:SPOR domain-containing protein [Novosphingobium mangrovi (ex Hu et al. 2023)]MCJ1962551.1 SPOR domain-containing protein [Novosphingobium mangrovi (ex Hu et al. 2023)]